MYKTDNYTRIVCTNCNQEVAVLKPGETFGNIPTCKCFVVNKVVGIKSTTVPPQTIKELREECDKRDIKYSKRDTIAILKSKLGE